MPAYFASDVHLRLDRPERALRFARWVDGLAGEDTLAIVGDLCDFWLSSRQRRAAARSCPGLLALAGFRSRGGGLTLLPGNHDTWLGAFYRETIGVDFEGDAVDVEAYGLRVHLAHGHRLRSGRPWKAWMEGRAFHEAFARIPSPVAQALDGMLDRANRGTKEASDLRHLAVFREYAASRAGAADLVVLGHVHAQHDEAGPGPRMIVLGGWHARSSFLRIDASGPRLIGRPDPALGFASA